MNTMDSQSKSNHADSALMRPPQPYTGKAPESAYETLKTIVLVLLAAFLIRSFIVQPFVVQGKSMEPTLVNNEYLLVEKISYYWQKPQRGDIIVFHAPVDFNQNYIKRVIAVPGETVLLKGTEILVNNKPILENYTYPGQSFKKEIEYKLGNDEYFVLGDNRDHSSDSRHWGPLNRQNIIGRAVMSIFPLSTFGLIQNPF